MTESVTTARMRWPASAFHELTHRPGAQLPALDGLRAMAVLLVICDHWVYEWVTVAGFTQLPITKLPFFYWGWTGVDLFFVLSGFLIGKQLWGELYRSGTIGVGAFVLRRGLRIWPLYYVMMLLFLLVSAEKAPSWPDWVMLSNYVPTRYGRSWSLSTEEQFYLLMPTLLLVFRRWIPARFWPLCIVGMLGLVAVSRAATHAALTAQGGLDPQRISIMMYSAFHLHCEPLLIGLLIAWIVLRRPAWLSPAPAGKVAGRALAGAACLALLGIALRTANREVFAYLALGCVYGAALCAGLSDRSWLTAPLRWKPWYLIARLSFGMYLNHLILREPTETILAMARTRFGTDSLAGFLVGLVLTILGSAVFAAVTFVLVEQPGLAWRDRWMDKRKLATVASRPTTVTS